MRHMPIKTGQAGLVDSSFTRKCVRANRLREKCFFMFKRLVPTFLLLIGLVGTTAAPGQSHKTTPAELQKRLDENIAEQKRIEERAAELLEEQKQLEKDLGILDGTGSSNALEEETFGEKIDRVFKDTQTYGSPFATLEYQFDTRGFNLINLTGGAPLPGGVNLFGFVDIYAPNDADSSRADTAQFFYEITARKKLVGDWGAFAEVNDAVGEGNSLIRAGAFYNPGTEFMKRNNLMFLVKFGFLETDGEGWQIGSAWNKKFSNFWGGRFSMGGFLDINFDSGADKETHIVSDTQLRLRLADKLSLLAEFRYNEFLSDEEFGTGIGLQYRF